MRPTGGNGERPPHRPQPGGNLAAPGNDSANLAEPKAMPLPLSPPRLRGRFQAAAAGLLAVHFLLAWTATLRKSPTFDECLHLTRAYTYWLTGDFRLSPPAPPLPMLWAGAPALVTPVKMPPRNDPAWKRSRHGAFSIRFLFESGNDLGTMLRRSRAMIALGGVLLGWTVFLCARAYFGPRAGLAALTLYVFSPTMLAHAGLVTADLLTAWCFLLVCLLFWRAFHRVTPARVAGAALALAALFLCKLTAFLALPMLGLLLLFRVFSRPPILVSRGEHRRPLGRISGRAGRMALLAGILGIALAVAWAGLWAGYGFRYAAFRKPMPGQRLLLMHNPETRKDPWAIQCAGRPRMAAIIRFCRRRRLFPELYLYSVAMGTRLGNQRCAFLDGRHSMHGFPDFFPRAFLYKTALPLLLALGFALALGAGTWSRMRHPGKKWKRFFYRTAPLWVLSGLYWAALLRSHLDIGHRHLLPAYPPLIILAGGGIVALTRNRARGLRRLAALLLAAQAITACIAWPNYLAYFNLAAGGAWNGYRHLVDSSLDWGQDLPGLKTWLDRNARNSPVFLAYFGLAPPAYYGIHAYAMPFEKYPYRNQPQIGTSRLTPGLYCISATHFQQTYVPQVWNGWTPALETLWRRLRNELRPFLEIPVWDTRRLDRALARAGAKARRRFQLFQKLRFARLCLSLHGRSPDAEVGGSILIFHLSAADLKQAGIPPAPP